MDLIERKTHSSTHQYWVGIVKMEGGLSLDIKRISNL